MKERVSGGAFQGERVVDWKPSYGWFHRSSLWSRGAEF